MDSLTTLRFLFTASLGIVTLAIMGYVFSDHSPQMRFTLVASLLVVFTLLTLAPLLSLTSDPEFGAAFEKKAKGYVEAQEVVPAYGSEG